MLEIRELNKRYRGKPALKQINLTIGQGEIVGLFGENGAGKTTLLKCILGYLSYQGTIRLDQEKVNSSNITRLSFATCEHSFFPNLTVQSHKEFYQMHFRTFREARFRQLTEFFKLPEKKAVKFFSAGQKNQLEVILALCQGADYILMDEPFAGNDIFNREDFYKILVGILEPEETILIATHFIEETAHFFSRAVLLQRGELIGDCSILELEEQGEHLVDYIKRMYHYQANRVEQALQIILEEKE